MSNCVNCEAELKGGQALYCSNACKQAVKYRVAKGEWCKGCNKPMRPRPVMGGYIPYHKACWRRR